MSTNCRDGLEIQVTLAHTLPGRLYCAEDTLWESWGSPVWGINSATHPSMDLSSFQSDIVTEVRHLAEPNRSIPAKDNHSRSSMAMNKRFLATS